MRGLSLDLTYAFGSVLWGWNPTPRHKLSPLDPVLASVIDGFSNQQHSRSSVREHGFFWQLRKSYLDLTHLHVHLRPAPNLS
ncbi:hypothetical protein L6R29_23985 [Myxococcota bacterium]|nr:hypothetical protein [Myxococcota bacterium]